MTTPQDPQQIPTCQDPTNNCIPAPIVPDAVFICGGNQQVDQCTGPTQTGEAPVTPTPVVTVSTSTPPAVQLPSTGAASGAISGLAALALVVGIVFARIGRLTSAR